MLNIYWEAGKFGINKYNDGCMCSPLEDEDFIDFLKQNKVICILSWKLKMVILMPEKYQDLIQSYRDGYLLAIQAKRNGA
jgi:hypothetical protein